MRRRLGGSATSSCLIGGAIDGGSVLAASSGGFGAEAESGVGDSDGEERTKKAATDRGNELRNTREVRIS